MPKSEWTPFERGRIDIPKPEELIARMKGHHTITLEEATREVERLKLQEIWINSIYQVNILRLKPNETKGPELIHLSIKRRDKDTCHDWRDFQRIKNELVGPEFEAVELYPAESRLVDTANQYHLWVINDPTFRWPFGFGERLVIKESGGGATQRPITA